MSGPMDILLPMGYQALRFNTMFFVEYFATDLIMDEEGACRCPHQTARTTVSLALAPRRETASELSGCWFFLTGV